MRLVDVDFGASRFVAVGDRGLDGEYMASGDGLSWTSVEAPWTGPGRAVLWTGSELLVLAGEEVWRSDDAEQWDLIGSLPQVKATPRKELGEDPQWALAWDGSRIPLSREMTPSGSTTETGPFRKPSSWPRAAARGRPSWACTARAVACSRARSSDARRFLNRRP